MVTGLGGDSDEFHSAVTEMVILVLCMVWRLQNRDAEAMTERTGISEAFVLSESERFTRACIS